MGAILLYYTPDVPFNRIWDTGTVGTNFTKHYRTRPLLIEYNDFGFVFLYSW